jgi:SagB-type dehydrogenase family enzyme
MTATAITHLKLHPFARIELQEPLACDVLLDERRAEIPDPRYLPLLAQLEVPTDESVAIELAAHALGVDRDHARRVIDQLVSAGVLVDAGAPVPRLEQTAFWERRGWIEGLILHQQTRNRPPARGEGAAARDVELWKDYPGAPAIELPAAQPIADAEPLAEVMLRRRCNRAYRQKTLSLAQLSALLHYGSADVLRLRLASERARADSRERLAELGSWAAIETYVAIHAVDGIAPGLYHYDLRHHRLVIANAQVRRADIVGCCEGQKISADGACNVLLTAVWQRAMVRDGHPRGYRNLLINTAELAHRYLLLATALGLSTYMTPQTLFRKTQQIFGVPHFEEALMYVTGMG